jgi:hypothetical protein
VIKAVSLNHQRIVSRNTDPLEAAMQVGEV